MVGSRGRPFFFGHLDHDVSQDQGLATETMIGFCQRFTIEQILLFKIYFGQMLSPHDHFDAAGRARGTPSAFMIERKAQLFGGIEQ